MTTCTAKQCSVCVCGLLLYCCSSVRFNRSALLLRPDAAGFVDVARVIKDSLDKLAEQALHVALAAREQTLEEGDMPAVSRQQQGHVGQVLDYGQRESCGEEEDRIRPCCGKKNQNKTQLGIKT